MTRKADTLRPFLRCAAVVLCSLALPLAVFALWDRALLAAPHIRTDGERFSAAGRANATACTLYAAEHVTKVPLGSNSVWDGGWTAGTMDGSALARARRTLRALHEAGLLCDDSYAAALSVCRLDYGSWELYTAPCGLTQLVRRPKEIYTGADTEHVYIQLILSDDDAPLYFNYQNDLGQGDTLANDAVAQYCALLGLDEFTDWQYPDWGTAVRTQRWKASKANGKKRLARLRRPPNRRSRPETTPGTPTRKAWKPPVKQPPPMRPVPRFWRNRSGKWKVAWRR